jgi:serine/threonine protein kinase
VNSASGAVWLTGFGIASRLPRERQSAEPPGMIAGTLAYMAPEQTGRMNRSIDSRSDLYSLGVTFYEMLTGLLPFSFGSDGVGALPHCSAAGQARPAWEGHSRTGLSDSDEAASEDRRGAVSDRCAPDIRRRLSFRGARTIHRGVTGAGRMATAASQETAPKILSGATPFGKI